MKIVQSIITFNACSCLLQVCNSDDRPLLHIFRQDNINLADYPGIPCNIFISKNGKCYETLPFKPAQLSDLFESGSFSIDALLKALHRLVQITGKLCIGVEDIGIQHTTSVVKHEWPIGCFRSKTCNTFTVRKRLLDAFPADVQHQFRRLH